VPAGEFADCPLQLVDGGVDVLQGEGGEAGEPAAAAGDLGGQEVVDPPGRAHRDGRIGDPFHASDGVGQDGDIDTGGVHLLDPALAQVAQPLEDHRGELRVEPSIARSFLSEFLGKAVPEMRLDLLGVDEVLLDGDLAQPDRGDRRATTIGRCLMPMVFDAPSGISAEQ
jgi:hypothetical protein